ncbi:MAG TPA: phosphotransferase, partial [Polyangiaceae bacterium]
MSRPLESLPNTVGSESAAERLRNLVASALPGAQILRVRSLGPDTGSKDANAKGAGYGAPLRIDVHHEGRDTQLVLRSATANEFGHDRRADRAEAAILAADTFGALPRHVSVLDVGAYKGESEFVSLAGTGEFYLLTTYSAGRVYAEDLREIARNGMLSPRDLAHCQSLVDYLVELHAQRPEHPNTAYARFVRDTLGSGEGIFGIIDGYPDDVPAAPRCRLEHIEDLCLRWRHRLRHHQGRLRRTHGDFHPFNVLFDEASELALLDTSRGSVGD